MRQVDASSQVLLFDIASQMKNANLSHEFVAAAVRVAMEYEGVYDLMVMWSNEENEAERDEVIADIQDMIDDVEQAAGKESVYIRFDDLEAIAANIRKFKDELRLIVDKRGGLTKLATLTGIPQPSLSRFFNTNSMPRRTTLLKIAKALDLDAVQIATEWARD